MAEVIGAIIVSTLSALSIGLIVSLLILGHKGQTVSVERLKAAGLAYYDRETGELIIDLPEVDQ